MSTAAPSPTDLPGTSSAGSAGMSRVELPAGRTGARLRCEVVLPDGCRVMVPEQCDARWLRQLLAAVRDSAGLVPQTLEAGPSC